MGCCSGGGGVPSLYAADAPSDSLLQLSTASLACDYMEYRSSDNVVNARGHAVAVSSGTQLEADEMNLYLSSQVIVAQGHAVMISSGTRLEADELTLHQSSQEAVARGHIFLQDQELTILAKIFTTTGAIPQVSLRIYSFSRGCGAPGAVGWFDSARHTTELNGPRSPVVN